MGLQANPLHLLHAFRSSLSTMWRFIFLITMKSTYFRDLYSECSAQEHVLHMTLPST